MATITDAIVTVAKSGQGLRADCFGNNAAIECPQCLSYPVLLIARENQRGSSAANPAICRHCSSRIYVLDDVSVDRLTVLNLAVTTSNAYEDEQARKAMTQSHPAIRMEIHRAEVRVDSLVQPSS